MSHTDPQLMVAWLIPLFPLVGYLFNAFFGGKVPKWLSGTVGTVAAFASFAVACYLFTFVSGHADKQWTVYLAPWLVAPAGPTGVSEFQVNFELLIDPLSVLMMLIITGVGGLIHLYSIGYMAADKGFARFFAYMNLFVMFMLILVMGNNFLLLFVGWEGVGLCSYLLIGYFFDKPAAADASKKAFIVNRIGDVGVMIGMFFIFHFFGTLDFVTGHSGAIGILDSAPGLVHLASASVITTLLLMLFFGCTGKSAQIPLYTWLPDAMEGPTPVSALIHAATMVTAGVYLVSRTHALFVLSDTAMITVAAVGIATALFAATIGLMQNDIKRVLAYSTVSQLGYMFAACGAGVFAAGMYHVMTHAFFKACLFLASGSVIHAVEHGMHAHGAHGESADEYAVPAGGPDPRDAQDMRNMGGLFGKIPVTAVSMIAATLAISGVWPFAGFWSKDQILWRTWQTMPDGNWWFWGIGALTALLTAFYMGRLIMKTFVGAPRTEGAKNAHKSPLTMLIPIGILAVLATITGRLFVPFQTFSNFLAPSVGAIAQAHTENMEPILGYGLLILVVLVLIYCFTRYASSFKTAHAGELLSSEERANRAFGSKGWVTWLLVNKYFVDEAYNFWFVKLGKDLSNWLWQTFDVGVVDGIVNGFGWLTTRSGQILRQFQNGYVRSYAFSMTVGILLVLIGCLAGLNYVR